MTMWVCIFTPNIYTKYLDTKRCAKMKRRFRNGQVPFDPKKVSQSFDVKRFDTKKRKIA